MLTDRFEDALIFAFRLHAAQVRKTSQVPFMAHLLAVAGIVLDHGGSEDEAIAALLHDAAEDQGGLEVLNSIGKKFGVIVARIVDGCTDTYEHPKPPWKDRKEAYLNRLLDEEKDVRFVSLADKVHNARSLILELRKGNDSVWDQFKGGKEGTLWYYNTLKEVYLQTGRDLLTEEFSELVNRINDFAK